MCYQCPLCHHPLEKYAQQWCCSNNHQFDCAKEGYVNLMPVQFKRSQNPGDSVAMMQARRAFLDAGFYQPLREQITRLLDKYLHRHTGKILDIGCGEGYYTSVWQNLPHHESLQIYGLDIAKVAIRYAAKRYPHVAFCVSSSQRLPYQDASMDAVIRIYAPCNAQELARVVAGKGLLVTVSPAARHLYQLKALVYPSVQLHAEKTELLPDFCLEAETRLNYPLSLPGEHAVNLLQMTPFAWRASERLFAQLGKMPGFSCEADFLLRVYRRKCNNM